AANLNEGMQAPRVLGKLSGQTTSRLEKVYADNKYHCRACWDWLKRPDVNYEIVVVKRRVNGYISHHLYGLLGGNVGPWVRRPQGVVAFRLASAIRYPEGASHGPGRSADESRGTPGHSPPLQLCRRPPRRPVRHPPAGRHPDHRSVRRAVGGQELRGHR